MLCSSAGPSLACSMYSLLGTALHPVMRVCMNAAALSRCAACSAPGVLQMAQEGFAEARQALAILGAQAAEAARLGNDAGGPGSLEPDLARLAAQHQALGRVAAQNAVAVKVWPLWGMFPGAQPASFPACRAREQCTAE